MGLQARFAKEGMPTIIADQREQPYAVYLPWLAESEQLSQQVADAWNSITLKPDPPARGGKKTALADFAAAQGFPPETMAMMDKMNAQLKAAGLFGDDKPPGDCCIA